MGGWVGECVHAFVRAKQTNTHTRSHSHTDQYMLTAHEGIPLKYVYNNFIIITVRNLPVRFIPDVTPVLQ